MAATLRLLVLALAVVAATASVGLAPSPAPVESPTVSHGGRAYHGITNDGRNIKETCKLPKWESKYWMDSFKADPINGNVVSPHMMAAYGLSVAAIKATENVGYITSLVRKFAGEPKLHQCLTDCTEQYQDAIKQIKDAEVALENDGYLDAVTWVKAAMTDINTCQASCKLVAGHKNILTQKNGDLNHRCSIIISIINCLK